MLNHKILMLLFAISGFPIIACCLIMMIIYDYSTENVEKVWMASKIKTVIDIISKKKALCPFLDINSNLTGNRYPHDYEYLLNNSHKNCEDINYQKCGILDTYGNIMCIPKEEKCPVNEIIIDFYNKTEDYISKGYNSVRCENLSEDYALYYTNNKIDKRIYVNLSISSEHPRYLNNDTFLFDDQAFIHLIGYPSYDNDYYDYDYDYDSGSSGYDYDYYDDDDDDDYGGEDPWWSFRKIKKKVRKKHRLRKLEYDEEEELGNYEVWSYIYKKMDEDENIDNSYDMIGEGLYAGTYIGFKDYSGMNKYQELDLREMYLTIYPNLAAVVFAYMIGIGFFIAISITLIVFYSCDCCDDDCFCFIMYGMPFFYFFLSAGHFSYSLYEKYNIYGDGKIDELTNIRADPFLEGLLSVIRARHPDEIYILLVIILIYLSFGLSLVLSCVIGSFRKKSSSQAIEKTNLLSQE